MATPLANYQTAYQIASDQIVIYLAALVSGSISDDVLSYGSDGQTATRKDILSRLEGLYSQQKMLLELMQIEDGPMEIRSYGVTV